MTRRTGLASLAQIGLGLVQGVVALFGAGSIIFAAHNLFLRYYANEWAGIQFSGVNGCKGEEVVANGDLLEGQTLCNQPENFMPWIELYRRHWQAALLYYGAAAVLILFIGFLWSLTQRRRASVTPFGGPTKIGDLSEHEHLR
jgi:hypothetical protein